MRKIAGGVTSFFLISLLLFSGCSNAIEKKMKEEKVIVNVATDIDGDYFQEYLDYFNLDHPEIVINKVCKPSLQSKEEIMKEGKNTTIDVWFGNLFLDTLELEQNENLEGYKPKGFDNIRKEFKDSHNAIPLWTGVGAYTIGVASKKKYTKALERDFLEGLISPQLKANIAMVDPEKGGAGYLFIEYIYNKYGEEKSKELYSKLKRNINYLEEFSYKVSRRVNDDREAVAITTDYDGLFAQWDDFEVDLNYVPEESKIYNLETIALIKKENIKPEARTFIDWMTSQKALELYKKNREILVDGQSSTIERAKSLKLLQGDYINELKKREHILTLWKEAE